MQKTEIKEIYLRFFEQEKIEYFSGMPIDEAVILYPRKLPESAKYATFFLVPYYCGGEERNISMYAVARDYHILADVYEKRLREMLSHDFSDIAEATRVFADNSPFAEVSCAVSAGLGTRGKNRLLINERYGSFVFVFSVTSPVRLDISSDNFTDKKNCIGCSKCIESCPTGALSARGECMSALTQKKRLTDDEAYLVASHPLVWGCDICQDVCPMNKGENTPIEFFLKDRTPYLTKELLSSMDDEEFSSRAYSWRGRGTIERNLACKSIITEKK